MDTIKKLRVKNHTISVVTSSKQQEHISANDVEMDARAKQAVKSAIEKSIFCRKPVAKYDLLTKKAYLEFSDGSRKYVD